MKMKKKTLLSKILSVMLTVSMVLALLPSIQPSAETNPARVSVHDPSILKSNEGTYYLLGSHVASAKSSDLMNWEQVSTDYQNVDAEPFYGDLSESLSESFAWAGYDDGDAAGGKYAIWAPDVIWNSDYQWEDGSTGAYMLYYSTSSTWRRSCIGYMVSKSMEETFQYVDTVIYSGFTKTGETDGNSTRNTKWDNDYLNLKELVGKGSANGGIDAISDNWFDSNGSWNQNYAPNAIDPTIFYDAEGALYMVYGSWSGGLFVLELDKATGQPLYPGTDSTDSLSGNITDRYFGTHIAGGNHQSGEGPYIQYDAETDYYYLYETYGGLTATGGYNMRLFRSKNVEGPYLDAAGNNAADSGTDNYKYGIKLMGNYKFFNQQGKRAAGHNSALIDGDSRYLVFHQRFNSTPQTEYHEVRVHQQFMNEDQWPVTAVYEYCGEGISNYAEDEIIGAYEYINHGNAAASGSLLPTETVNLNADGTVSGDETGTWTKSDSGKGYDYVTIIIGENTYKGVFYKQSNDTETHEKVLTFTAIGNDNTVIWGSKMDTSDNAIVNMAAEALDNLIPTTAKESITFPTALSGASISWTSSHPEVLNGDGAVNPQVEDTVVTLTASISHGDVTLTKEYQITVQAVAKLVYGYDFETAPGEDGSLVPDSESSKTNPAVLMGTASIVSDTERSGNVLQLTNDPGSKGVNFLRLPEDTLSTITEAGYSISMWVNVGSESLEHSALFEADRAADYPMTRIGVNLIGRINANGYSDVQGSLLSSNGYRNQWEKVVYTVNPQGIKVYLNGELVGEEQKDLTSCFDNSNDASIQKADQVSIGSGFIWNDEDIRNAKFDDVKVYHGILREYDVARDYNLDMGLVQEQTITVNSDSLELKTGETYQIEASTSGDGNFSYQSSNPDVVTVDEDGLITVKAESAADAVITITASETEFYNKAKTEIPVHILEPISQVITVSNTSYTVKTGVNPFQLNATCSVEDTTLLYSSSNEGVAKVDENGMVSIISAGSAVITITAPENIGLLEGTMTVNITVEDQTTPTPTITPSPTAPPETGDDGKGKGDTEGSKVTPPPVNKPKPQTSSPVKTGDSTTVVPYVLSAAGAGMILIISVALYQRNRKKQN